MPSIIRNIGVGFLLLPMLAACTQGGSDGEVARTGSVESDGDTTTSQESPDVGTNESMSDPGPGSEVGDDDEPPESASTDMPTMDEAAIRADSGTSAEPTPSADESGVPSSGGMTGGVAGCPALAATCPAGCYDIAARAIEPDAACYAPTASHLGCTASETKTDDEVCVVTRDGATLYTMSGTFTAVLTGSGEYRDCTEQEWGLLAEGLDVCTSVSDAASAPVMTDASVQRMYTAGLVNGTGCCDYVNLILADSVEDYCVIVSTVQEVGSPAELMGAHAARPADACELVITAPDGAAEATLVDGLVNIEAATPQPLMDLEVTVTFPEGSGFPETIDVQVKNLPVDREWHTGSGS